MAYAWGSLLAAVRTGAPAYDSIFGRPFWEDLQAHPDVAASFDALDGTGRARHARPGGAGHRRLGVGGHGGRRRRRHGLTAGGDPSRPALVRGTLVDLPPTVARSAETFQAAGVADRVTAVGQSFFDPLPAGADLYLLKNVLGDWPDREALALLRRCAEAAGPAAASSSSAVCRPTRASAVAGVADAGAGGRQKPEPHGFRELARTAGLDVQAAGRQQSGRFVVECRPSR